MGRYFPAFGNHTGWNGAPQPGADRAPTPWVVFEDRLELERVKIASGVRHRVQASTAWAADGIVERVQKIARTGVLC
jgi:hypothetical protein